MKKLITAVICLLLAGLSPGVFAQEKTPVDSSMFDMSLEDLMNITISSASKKEESLFDAPLSSYTITRADIDRAGSTSIVEALRMAPGVIVREQTNGTYDVFIRGFDNIVRKSGDYDKQNTLTLVMIDNRPIFNYTTGGTFWETLPIDINDVDRIEIVRGPSAPLFGPNAVSGVINIITKRSDKTMVNVNAQYGTYGTVIANASVGSASGNWTYQVSGNFQQRDRFDSEYYKASTGQFVDGAALMTNFDNYYPNPNRSMNKWGANGFVGFKPKENLSLDLSFGTQKSQVQKDYFGLNGTKLNNSHTESSYANLAAKWSNLSFRSSILSGNDNINYNVQKIRPNQYNYTVVDAITEYTFKLGDKYSITPGASYQGTFIDDTPYITNPTNPTAGFYNGKPTLNGVAGILRSDLNFTEKWRVVAALRSDKFSTHDKLFLAYELASTYKLNSKNLIRVAVTRSNSSSFTGYSKLNLISPTPIPGIVVTVAGNSNLKLQTIQMVEFGFRSKLNKNLQLDMDVFRQQLNNLAIIQAEVYNTTIKTATASRVHNLPTQAVQYGATLSLNYLPAENIQIKPFVTFQNTHTYDLPSALVQPSVDPNVTYSNSEHKSTPAVYGGYYANYKFASKWNVNLNGYYFSAHRQYDRSDATSTSDVGHISGKVLVNMKLNYALTKQISLYANARNMLNSTSREVFGTDHTGALYLVGGSFSLN